MADKGIIFSAPMVLALLAGRKTQTRRFCKPAAEAHLTAIVPLDVPPKPGWFGDEEGEVQFDSGYAPGQRLWVREAWCSTPAYDDLSPSEMGGDEPLRYLADDATFNWAEADGVSPGRRRASFHMPRWASRITLAVTQVRIERIQSITEVDAINEGMIKNPATALNTASWSHTAGGERWGTARDAYAGLWSELHTRPGETWHDDPWVSCISFSVEQRNVDGGAA